MLPLYGSIALWLSWRLARAGAVRFRGCKRVDFLPPLRSALLRCAAAVQKAQPALSRLFIFHSDRLCSVCVYSCVARTTRKQDQSVPLVSPPEPVAPGAEAALMGDHHERLQALFQQVK